MDRVSPRIVGALACTGLAVALLNGCASGGTMPDPLTFDGPVTSHRQGTQEEVGEVLVGLAQVKDERAVFHLSAGGEVVIVGLDVGEAGGAHGVTLRLCGVIRDTDVDEDKPGSDESRAYYVSSEDGTDPVCPALVTPEG